MRMMTASPHIRSRLQRLHHNPHASINTRADERLPPEQRMQAIDRLEKDLGLTGQPRAVVVHEKEGREHCHVVWSRIDLDKMRTITTAITSAARACGARS